MTRRRALRADDRQFVGAQAGTVVDADTVYVRFRLDGHGEAVYRGRYKRPAPVEGEASTHTHPAAYPLLPPAGGRLVAWFTSADSLDPDTVFVLTFDWP